MATFDPLGDLLRGSGLSLGAGRQPSPIQPYTDPQEESSVLGGITDTLLSGLGWAGSTIDKYTGGRAFKGLLRGNPRELLSIIPFSDHIPIPGLGTLTDPSQETSGRDVLENWGWLDKGANDWGSLAASVAADLALSPSTYLSGLGTMASATKAGRTAKAIGMFPKTPSARVGSTLGDVLAGATPEVTQAAERAAAIQRGAKMADVLANPSLGTEALQALSGDKLSHLSRWKIPFTGIEGGLGGPKSLEALSGAGDWLSKLPGVRTVNQGVVQPVKNVWGGLFEKATKGHTEPGMQEVQRGAAAADKASETANALAMTGLAREAAAMGIDTPSLARQVAGSMEGTLVGPVQEPIQRQVGIFKKLAEEGRLRAEAAGAPSEVLADPEKLGWAFRQKNPELMGGPGATRGSGMFDIKDNPMMKGRNQAFEGLPSQVIEAIMSDPKIATSGRALNDVEAADYIRRAIGMSPEEIHATQAFHGSGIDVPTTPTATPTGIVDTKRLPGRADLQSKITLGKYAAATDATKRTPEMLQALADLPANQAEFDRLMRLSRMYHQAPDLANIARGLPEKALTTPYFSQDLYGDFEKYLNTQAHVTNQADALANYAKLKALPAGVAPEGARSVQDVIKAKLANRIKDPGVVTPNMQGLDDLLMPGTVLSPAEFTGAEMAVAKKLGVAPDQLRNIHLPPEAVAAIGSMDKSFQMPEAVQKLLSVPDRFRELFKMGNTSPWPSFHIRNRFSGDIASLDKGLLGGRGAAEAIFGGEVPTGIAGRTGMGATDAAASQKLADLYYAHGVGQGNAISDIHGAQAAGGANPAAEYLSQIPGQNPVGWGDVGKKYASMFTDPESRFPLAKNESGQWAANQEFGPFAAGRMAGNKIEGGNRFGAFIKAIEQGMTPEVAAQEVAASHYRYNNLSRFEKEVMQRVVPFYNWSKSNLPYVAERITTAPGGVYGTATRTSADIQKNMPEQFIPPYLARGLALPIGGENAGIQRFLTSLGLPIEDLGLIKGGPKGFQNTLESALGQLDPLLKGPLEYATGKQFYTNRELADLHSPTGSTLADQVLMNSPLARVGSFLGQVTNPNKWANNPVALPFNFLTGLKLADVNMNKERDIAVRQANNETLRGQQGIGNFETLYLKPGVDPASLPPEQLAMLRLNRTMENRAKAAAKQRNSLQAVQQ